MDNGYSLGDLAAVTRSENGGFGGMGSEGLWVFALLILLFGGGGLGFGGNSASTQDIQRAVDLNSIQEGQREIASDVQRGIYEVNNSTAQYAYNNLGEIRDVQAAVNAGITAQQKCCCDTLRAIDGVNYNGAMNTAAINANTTAQTQKILDVLAQNKIDSLQAKVNELQTAQMFCGIPRVSPYGYGVVPQFANACGGCNVTNI